MAYNKPEAERLIVRGMAMNPDSSAIRARMAADTGVYEWPLLLSSLYASAIRGAEGVYGTYNDLRTHLDRLHSPYANEVRAKLEATTDAKLLARVGSHLVQPSGVIKNAALKGALEQIRALGIGYLERALALDPTLERAKATLVRIRLPERATEIDRLADRAALAYVSSEGAEYYQKDMVTGKQRRADARAQAEEVLKQAAGHEQDPSYSAAIMTAHHTLGVVALRDGDREAAVAHMRQSLKVPTSEQIQYAPPSSWMRPVNQLLKAGERERVVEFLEAYAQLTIIERDRLLKDAQAIREGRMPWSYQATVAREGQ